MKTNIFFRMLAFCLSLMSATYASAQITYFQDQLTLTGDYNATTGKSRSNFRSIRFNHYGGCYWTFQGTYSCFFQLDLTPKSPRLAGTYDKIVFYNTASSTFNSIEVANVYQASDERLKSNVKEMKSGLGSLMSLRPVTFNWKPQASKAKSMDADAAATSANDNSLQYGFLAQEVEEVLPDIVRDSDTGDKLVNYSAMIPILVQAVQELQQTVEAQAITIAELTASRPNAKAAATSANKIISCSPNPTSGFVSIETQLESDAEAEIIITSMAGNREKLLKVTEKTTTTDASALPAGIHIVSLYVGGQLADTCRLIKQ